MRKLKVHFEFEWIVVPKIVFSIKSFRHPKKTSPVQLLALASMPSVAHHLHALSLDVVTVQLRVHPVTVGAGDGACQIHWLLPGHVLPAGHDAATLTVVVKSSVAHLASPAARTKGFELSNVFQMTIL